MTPSNPPKAIPNLTASLPETNTEVVARAQRRRFTNADNRRILEAADRCSKPGEIGALMRRKGVYSSSLSTWRRQHEEAELTALAPQKRGPRADPGRADTQHIEKLTRDNQKLQAQLEKALLVIEVQKKSASCLVCCPPASRPRSRDGGRARTQPDVGRSGFLPGAGSVARSITVNQHGTPCDCGMLHSLAHARGALLERVLPWPWKSTSARRCSARLTANASPTRRPPPSMPFCLMKADI